MQFRSSKWWFFHGYYHNIYTLYIYLFSEFILVENVARDWLNPGMVLEAFEARALRMAVTCANNLSKFENQEQGFSELLADLVEAATAHCQLIVVSK